MSEFESTTLAGLSSTLGEGDEVHSSTTLTPPTMAEATTTMLKAASGGHDVHIQHLLDEHLNHDDHGDDIHQHIHELYQHIESVSDLPPTPHGQGPLHEHKLENGEIYTHHNPHVPIHDHGVNDEDSPSDKMYHLMHSDTILVIVALILMIVVGLVFRKLCMRLSKGKDRKKLVRVGLKGIADQMHNVTRSMSNELETPDSPRAVMRTYSNYNRRLRAQSSNDPSGADSDAEAGEGGLGEDNNNAPLSPHAAAKRMQSRDKLRIAVLESNQSRENLFVEAATQIEKAEVHEMKDMKMER